ncbi:FkbM family methyltransferase [Pseudodesulfovibrio cashew]|uniref:FkbM family methyltransferase n=1 Tax=Pseudodesulfovibrio cashew TaxID=2678688 RepID=A0A6I6JEA6_9BACT|nr:FkbM family methyltransferase [Pseudodesulfovibrio cashew]QGY39348.1 FkbM family methyltransferase [Pseudodesulfovibrio cashew]
MPETDFITLDRLPENGRVVVYGSGDAAMAVLERIREDRPDVTVPCLLDSFTEGEAGGLPVVRSDNLGTLAGQYDFILIASAWWRDIAKGLEAAGEAAWGVASQGLWHKYVYTEADLARYKGGLDAVEGLLATDRDKAVFRFLVEARREGSPLVDIDATNPRIVDYLQVKESLLGHLTGQYLDFVVREPVHTVLHAGVFDGSDCLNFLRAFPNLETIHGFEPQGEAHIKPATMDALVRSGKVRIHRKGLWNTSASVPLTGQGSYTTLRPDASPEQVTGTVETISVDEFVAEHKVARVDYLCLDVEGAEARALAGAKKTIAASRPQLAVCVYHKKEDLFRLPLLLADMLDGYVFHLGHYYHYLNETVLYAIPAELEA